MFLFLGWIQEVLESRKDWDYEKLQSLNCEILYLTVNKKIMDIYLEFACN